MRSPRRPEDRLVRATLALSGLALTAAALLAGDLARLHMARVGVICGAPESPHCGWCYAAAAFALMGTAQLTAALWPRWGTVAARAR